MPKARLQPTGLVVAHNDRLDDPQERLIERHVDYLSAAAALALTQRDHGAESAEYSGEIVAEGKDRDHGPAISKAGEGGETTEAFRDSRVASPMPIGSRLAEARHAHPDGLRVALCELARIEAPPLKRARLEVLDHDVAAQDQI